MNGPVTFACISYILQARIDWRWGGIGYDLVGTGSLGT